MLITPSCALQLKFNTTQRSYLKLSRHESGSPQSRPGSFVQLYDVEALRPVSSWQSFIDRYITSHVCVLSEGAVLSPEDALLRGEWVGYAAIRRPVAVEDYYPSPDMAQWVPDHPVVETRWHTYDLYTSPTHRGRGVAKKLWEAMLAIAMGDTHAMRGTLKRSARFSLFAVPRQHGFGLAIGSLVPGCQNSDAEGTPCRQRHGGANS
jgi:GNAT superfamily N-acetyltransferase